MNGDDGLTVGVAALVQMLSQAGGARAVALGGSRARGRAAPDSDYDLVIVYDGSRGLDTAAVRQAVTSADDDHNPNAATDVGQWGPWIDGGAWLHCAGVKVDVLYRDARLVERTIADCRAGRVRTEYQEGHPYAFHSYMLMGEAHHNRPLRDPEGVVAALRAQTIPYPDALVHAIVNRFLPEAEFTRMLIANQASRADAYYSAGLHFRLISCLVQTIFAANRSYFLNEKGSLGELMELEWKPAHFTARADALIRDHLERRLDAIDELVAETRAIAAELVHG